MLKKLLLILPFLHISLFGQESFEDKQEDPDMEALRKWIREKRMITVKEIGGDLSISGEVRFEFQDINEKKEQLVNGQKVYVKQRGSHGATSKPMYAYDAEVNLMMDYQAPRTWASIKLEFDNCMGLSSGSTNHINLERAFFGGRLLALDTFLLDFEFGRRNLGNIFDSKIEFSSLFDGILMRLGQAFQTIGELYLNLGGFIVDDRRDHYGFVGELGMLRIGNTGLYVKYSLIDWKKNYANDLKKLRYNYQISQFILGYQWTPDNFKKFIKIYGSFLCNQAADRIPLTKYHKDNWAGYMGISIGRVQKKGDWALDMNYQVVQAQAIPDFDAGGIKRGNAQAVGLYTENVRGTGAATTRENAVGNCNYRGFTIEFLYAFSNNLTVLQNFEISQNLDKSLGPELHYKKYELEFIYAF